MRTKNARESPRSLAVTFRVRNGKIRSERYDFCQAEGAAIQVQPQAVDLRHYAEFVCLHLKDSHEAALTHS
jgi:hypothetical protein